MADTMLSMARLTKSTEKKRHYCCVCSNYRGKLVNGRCITLHRFPMNEKLRNVWIKRIKTVSQNFVLKAKNVRLCSAHFANGTCTKNNIPSIFIVKETEKRFKTTKVNKTSVAEPAEDPALNQPFADFHKTMSDHSEEELDKNFNFNGNFHEASIKLHDYCGPVNAAVSLVNKNEQTDNVRSPYCMDGSNDVFFAKPIIDAGTQTNIKMCSRLTQTEDYDMNQVNEQQFFSVCVQCQMPEISIEDLGSNDKQVMFYTGLPNAGTFYALFDEMEDARKATRRNPSGDKSGRPCQLRIIDEFFLVLMRLRLGLLVEDLAQRFKIAPSTCSVVINKWIDYLSAKLDFLLSWPSRRLIDSTMPKKFQRLYPKTRVIIDCTEFFTENPQSLVNKSLMYSHYKSHMTYKVLLGISPSGAITFVSDMWAGSISDKQLTRSCGILDLCERGDAIMADKGFLISDLTTPRGIHLIIPPLKYQRFTRREVEETRRIANLRIYVEMAMARVKSFRILQGVAPITLSKQLGKIVKLCAGLSNLQPPLIVDDDL